MSADLPVGPKTCRAFRAVPLVQPPLPPELLRAPNDDPPLNLETGPPADAAARNGDITPVTNGEIALARHEVRVSVHQQKHPENYQQQEHHQRCIDAFRRQFHERHMDLFAQQQRLVNQFLDELAELSGLAFGEVREVQEVTFKEQKSNGHDSNGRISGSNRSSFVEGELSPCVSTEVIKVHSTLVDKGVYDMPPYSSAGEESMSSRPTRLTERLKKPPGVGVELAYMLGEYQGQGSAGEIAQECYDVRNFYHTSGFVQWVARKESFANVTLAVICMNAIYIGVDADWNTASNLNDAAMPYQVCENAFCMFFSIEWLLRALAFKIKADCLKDMWFKFDTILAILMMFETWIVPNTFSSGIPIPTGLIKMLRLLRLARMVRLMRSLPELMAMIKGVKVASRAVGSALMMLVLLVYVFAIILLVVLSFTENFVNATPTLSSRFSNLTTTMMTLLIDGTFMDSIGALSRSLADIPNGVVRCFSLLILWVFVLLSALTVMNMLIGVLCEVVSAVAERESEDAAIKLVKDTVLVMLKRLDEDNSGYISMDELSHVFENEEALDVLRSLDVDVTHLVDQLGMFFDVAENLSIPLIMNLILMLRGTRPVTMRDMLHMDSFSRWKMKTAILKIESENQAKRSELG
jgi:hypothetical protein